MFIGHYAVGFASKRLAPKAGLGPLMAAPILLDLVWPILVLAGVEQVAVEPGNTSFTPLAFLYYPYSHSLLAVAGWGIAYAAAYWLVTRYLAGAAVMGIGVISHWLLDALVHRPDLPLYPGGPMFGLGLWNSVGATFIVELAVFTMGVILYVASTRARDRVGHMALYAFLALTLLMYIGNAAGPPPPSIAAVAMAGLAQWTVPLWAAWFDRHRSMRR